jgi:hypothetical protein
MTRLAISESLRGRLRAYWRVARWAVFAAAFIYCVLALSGAVPYGGTPPGQIVMADGAAYYFLETPYDWTDRPPGVAEYRYSPAFLWLTAPLRLLPWELFVVVWFAAHVGTLLYLRVPWMLAFPGVVDDVVRGNINTFLALAVVLVIRHAASPLWSVVLLTKVTPGIAVIWHAARREWRQFAIALAVTAAIIVVGVAIDPELWTDWIESLGVGLESYRTVGFAAPLIVRVGIGLAISVFAAVSDRAWLLPIGMLVAVPGLWPSSFALLTASVVLYLASREGSAAVALADGTATTHSARIGVG